MDFDFGFDEFTETTTQTPREREPLPEGVHELLIKDVRIGDVLELRLAHEDARYGWVFQRLDPTQGWAREIGRTLLPALGMTPAEWAAADPSQISGRLVRAEIYHRAGNTGKTWVNVRRFLPVEKPAPVQKSPPRTAGEKAMKTAMEPNDDIPF
jgi:hypothetical protein